MKIWIWVTYVFLLLPFYAEAQRQTEYNRKGDEAMNRKDYRDAKMWYEEGVSYCDQYSIDKLTEIWLKDTTMHVSMRTVMNKCLNCLNEFATEQDTLAIQKLILYYTQGIGTTPNKTTAGYWRKQLENIRHPNNAPTFPKKSSPMRFFAGYHFSALAPFGIQLGGANDKIGWYIRVQSNLSFKKENEKGHINGDKFILENINQFYGSTGTTRAKTVMGSAGVMIKTFGSFYTSVGMGYWNRDLLREYHIVNDEGVIQTTGWAKDVDSSEKGLKVDLDGIVFFNKKHFYLSGGCSILNFKYCYPNIGMGIVF